MSEKAAPQVTLLPAASVYVFPGRGVGAAKASKLPKPAAVFADLAAAWAEDPGARERAEELAPRDHDATSYATALAALEGGVVKGAPTPRVAAAVWRALEPTWRSAWHGTPAVLTRGKRLGEKFAAWLLASGGAGYAMEALRETWRRADGDASPDIDHAFWYLERQFAGFAALRALRERLAAVSDADYAAAVTAGRAAVGGLPAHLQAAIAFALPTERDLAVDVLARTEANTEPYMATASLLNLSPTEPDTWPGYVAFLSWSLRDERDFARTLARRFFVGQTAWAVACASLHPRLLTEYAGYDLTRHKMAR